VIVARLKERLLLRVLCMFVGDVRGLLEGLHLKLREMRIPQRFPWRGGMFPFFFV
jgi:hypothetical protein